MLCPKCGVTVSDRARSCGSCGQTIDVDGDMTNTLRIPPALLRFGAESLGAAEGWTGSDASLPGLFARIKNVLLNPRAEWPLIAVEPTSIAGVYRNFVAPLAALAAVMSFLRLTVIGVRLPSGDLFRTPPSSGLIYAAVSFGLGLLGVFLVSLVIDSLAPTFGGARDRRQALKTAAYAFTPAWLSSVLALVPGFAGLLQLAAGLYGIYLLYLGLPLVMGSSPDKSKGYTAAVVLSTMVLGIGLSAVGGVVFVMGARGP